ncbi:hypothetical protein F5Y12DRAFT_796922 [Xylaria sp. FL1777]|nr:hypothetical protein F5Y12DRAFT_796922 [Xylaria sp. FL1777]
MLRRSHKKTKKGSKCEECRRRHIRASSNCINCRNSDRICIYKPTDPTRAADTSSSAANAPSHEHTRAPPHEEIPREPSPSQRPLARTLDDSLINILHLELFSHFMQGTFLFIDRDNPLTDQVKKTALSSAFSNPYLMHGILAFSARHISTQVSLEISHYYLNQSTTLQTWAVTNFNPAPPEPDQDTCVALFLFSSLICVHGLADIAPLDLPPERFLIRFGHYFGLQRGVRTIIGDYRSQLEQSKIQNIIKWCDLAVLGKGEGPECDSIRQLVVQSTDLSPSAIEACHLAIEQLQCVLDGCSPHQPMPVHCVYLTLAWPLLVHEKLVDLLVLRRPVALVILAYYGVALDICRDLWMVGQAGRQIVHAVNMFLGPKWAPLLRWPCDVVSNKTLRPDGSSTI